MQIRAKYTIGSFGSLNQLQLPLFRNQWFLVFGTRNEMTNSLISVLPGPKLLDTPLLGTVAT
jgi:hypothetical protein